MLTGKRVGLLDVDIHGPSVPTMLGLENLTPQTNLGSMLPVELGDLKVMSIGFLLKSRDDAIIWRGPMKARMIKQFLMDVEWGELDYLIIDSPPGTGDEPLSVCQLVDNVDGALIVTTPQDVATADVRKSISFCRRLNLPVLGVIENMSGFICPKCGEETAIFQRGGGKRMAEEMDAPFLGQIPIDPKIVEMADSGKSCIRNMPESALTGVFEHIVERIMRLSEKTFSSFETENNIYEEKRNMRIAIPLADGKLAMHFGHCESFSIVEADLEKKMIVAEEIIESPPHQPGLLPRWLAGHGAQVIIAGGMGQRAQSLFAENNIEVNIGASSETPEQLVMAYLNGNLETGDNICDH